MNEEFDNEGLETSEVDLNSTRLDKYIKQMYGKNIPQSIIERAIRNKDILLNGVRAKSSDRVGEDDEVMIHASVIRKFDEFLEETASEEFKINSASKYLELFKSNIIFENENFLIINKPSGMAVQLGTKTNISLDFIAKSCNPEARLVHRIDKSTSGITIFAKNLKSSKYMLDVFKNKKISKEYTLITQKRPSKDAGTISAPLLKTFSKVVVDFENGKDAVTKFEVIKSLKNGRALVKAKPITGRTHQIRVHMAFLGCPIVGDMKYSDQKSTHLCLHASRVSFRDLDGTPIIIDAPLPSYMLS